ncbi:HD domain-containing phosphohydrolase [Poseidonibacter lekithochrous]|uniref:HD domain-containing phosphohydrolase n=1 Tax=Poseidonibacter lekithochrous TaxID=1904463 RepID=UPI0008FC407E|nr:HD domain-containing phosphohydrolase [Poseidonibacter lekithochrous]
MNYIKILGASGSKTKTTGTTSFQIFNDIVIDAGNIINSIGKEALYVNHIFLTHSHSDHITDLPFMLETFFEKRTKPLIIYALKETIQSLKSHTFNNEIWPDFTKINMINSDEKSLIFKEIELNEIISLGEYQIKPIHANHIEGSCGYIIEKDDLSFAISGDTYVNDSLWEEVNNNKKIKSLIIECSFPSEMDKLAHDSKHLTPKILASELEKLKRDDVQIFLYHLKASYHKRMQKEINDYNILKNNGKILEEGDVIHIDTGLIETDMIPKDKFERIMEINLALSNELNKDRLFEMILTLTKELTHADGGTLYIMSKDKRHLDFTVVHNNSLNIFMGGTKEKLTWNSLPLYLENGEKNLTMVAAVAALENKIVNIEDVYEEKAYNFEGTKAFDKNTGYRSKSMLVIPLINHENDVIGVLQLINKEKDLTNIIPFDASDERIIKALAGQAAMALTNSQLINSLEEFIAAFITTIGHAIDAKSPHTKNHIEKVAKISNLLAQAINDDKTIYKDIEYSIDDFKQIEIAAWMHDIGKISMPESIIEKSTKLQTLFDRIELIKERFEVLKRDTKIDYLEGKISKEEYEEKELQLSDDCKFLETANIGEEFMDDSKLERIIKISKYTYMKNGKEEEFLTKNELNNLSIRRGTLTDQEKRMMNSHAQLSLDMLEELPFPKKYSEVLNIAANHHEKLNGKGYPRGLSEKDLTLEDKIMILADIFEALTSSDRPYKDGKKLSEVFKILSFMVKDYEIDGELLKFFHEHEVLKEYSHQELKHTQIDESKLLY